MRNDPYNCVYIPRICFPPCRVSGRSPVVCLCSCWLQLSVWLWVFCHWYAHGGGRARPTKPPLPSPLLLVEECALWQGLCSELLIWRTPRSTQHRFDRFAFVKGGFCSFARLLLTHIIFRFALMRSHETQEGLRWASNQVGLDIDVVNHPWPV